MIYARYIEPMSLITKEYAIYDDIPNSFDSLKIVHFSDLHYNRALTINKVKDIVKEINLINPDIVVFTGDLVDEDVYLEDKDYDLLINTLKEINAKYGKYAILGNHDYNLNINKVIDTYKSSDFKYLDNNYDIIYSNSLDKIFLGGINNYKEEDTFKIFDYFNDTEDENIYKIILTHEPDITDDILEKKDINLILAGHSHNGQIRLPIVGAMYTPPGSKKYYDNHYKINDTNLYISSGIGFSLVNYRFLDKPSINFYRIYSNN